MLHNEHFSGASHISVHHDETAEKGVSGLVIISSLLIVPIGIFPSVQYMSHCGNDHLLIFIFLMNNVRRHVTLTLQCYL